jgi:hypothetical protein
MFEIARVDPALIPDAEPASAALAALDAGHAVAVADAVGRIGALAPGLPVDDLRRDPAGAEWWQGHQGATEPYELPGPEDLDALLDGQPMTDGRLVLSRGAEPIDPGLVFAPRRRRPGAPAMVNPARLRGVLGEGVTAQLAHVDEVLPGLRAACLDLERAFPGRAKADLFLAQGTTSGLGPHFDDAELLVVQLEGTKRWVLHRPDVVHPRRGFVDEARALQEGRRHEAADVVLAPGDLLYVPQGWWHEPAPVGGRSVHVTLAISRPAVHEAAEQLLRWARHHDGRWRAPVGESPPGDVGLALDADGVDRWRRGLRGGLQARPSSTLSTLWDLGDGVGLDDAVVTLVAPGGAVPVAEGDGVAVVWLGGHELHVDPAWLPTLAVLADGRSHRVTDLPSPPDESAWPAVTALATEGVVDLWRGPTP